MRLCTTRFTSIILASLLLGACATQPADIPASSVSTLQYDGYSCKQVAAELARLERKSTDLYYSLKKTADNDSTQMAVGMILFWPTLFFLEGGDGPQAAEYARIKGELEALETVSVRKKCGLTFPEAPKPKPVQQPAKNSQQNN